MFYDSSAIQYLVDRIGWAAPIPPISLSLSPENNTATSQRYYNWFHRLATVENMAYTIANPDVVNDDFNDYLYDIKKQAVLSVLASVFDNCERANYRYGAYYTRVDISNIEYSDVIKTGKPSLFDNAIGYTAACKILEDLLSSVRKNGVEREIGFDWTQLKAELEGIRNEYGKIMTTGLYALKKMAIDSVIDILFPENAPPLLIGRHPW